MSYLTHGKRRPRRDLFYAAGVAVGVLATAVLLWIGIVVAAVWIWGLVV